MLVVRSVAGPMVVREADTVVLSAPVVTPSASGGAIPCATVPAGVHGEDPERPTLASAGHVDDRSVGRHSVHGAQRVYGADVEPRLLTSTVSHLIRSWCSPAGPTGYPIAGHLEGPSDEHRELGRVDVRRQWMARVASIRHTT